MEQPLRPDYLTPLTQDLKALIIQELVKSQNIDEAVKSIRKLSRTNREFRQVVNDQQLTKWIIYELSQKKYVQEFLNAIPKGPREQRRPELGQNARLIFAAASLNTPASIQWLHNYLQDPTNKIMAEYLLVQMAGRNVNVLDGLLKTGVNPNARSPYYGFASQGDTALSAAVISHYIPGIKRLLAAGANIHILSAKSYPILVEAIIERNHPDTIKLLLDAGAKNDKSALSEALFSAVQSRLEFAIPIIQLLLDAGAPLNQKNYIGQTVLDVAASRPVKDINLIAFLESRGAREAKRPSEKP